MASASAMHNTLLMTNSVENQTWPLPTRSYISGRPTFFGSRFISSPNTTSLAKNHGKKNYTRPLTVVAAFGDVSSDGTAYLIAGAAAVALLGTAFPILFSRKDLCPECDGAGFIRKTGATLRANAARKDQAQIVCPNCNGLGKLNQIDK